MAWEDKPTDNQIRALVNFLGWHANVSDNKNMEVMKWVEGHATRKQVSDELGRLRDLYIAGKLNEKNAFESPIYDGFEFDDDKYPTEKQKALLYAIFEKYMSLGRATLSVSWLAKNATKEEMAKEIDRVKELDKRHALDEEECFISDIWKGKK